MILDAIDEAVRSGARLSRACEMAGISVRTVERWRTGPGEDLRCGPRTEPGNKLTVKERREVLELLGSPQYRDLSPKQIVPLLADEGRYIASESTMYRLLREADLLKHREPSKAPEPRPRIGHMATGPNQVWSWDITYLRSNVRGAFHLLYMVEDVWSRKIVAWAVHDRESPELASALARKACRDQGIDAAGLVLHSDNGGAMKGATMLATLNRLGIVASFSRPRVSDDNPYSEALFRTMKYRPEYPQRPFRSMEEARAWVEVFVRWYNNEHLHSAIGFVTPADRHAERDAAILARRERVYEHARRHRPQRWSGKVRSWARVETVHLNPTPDMLADAEQNAA